MSAPEIGERVADKHGYFGTVRYVGPVCAAKDQEALYAGIEWDDDSRGKHDGSVLDAEGGRHRYFTCPEGAGSFLKASKVQRGVDFLNALRRRYEDSATAGADARDMLVQTSTGGFRPVELVGGEKTLTKQRAALLAEVSLDLEPLSHAGPDPDAIAAACPHARELSMARTLLSDWREVGRIVAALPDLRLVTISGNRMRPDTLDGALADLARGMHSLQVLVLNGTGVSWPDTLRVAQAAPVLRELHVARCGIASLAVATAEEGAGDAPLLPALEVLDVSLNALEDWAADSATLARCPALARLNANGNGYATVAGGAPLPALRALSLSANPVASWAAVDALGDDAALPALAELRLQRNPVLGEVSPPVARRTVIARLPRLTALNGSAVRSIERDTAERAYLRQCLLAVLERAGEEGAADDDALARATRGEIALLPGAVMDDLRRAHPRFDALVDKHGPPSLAGADEAGPRTIGQDLCALTLRCVAASGADKEPAVKRVPASMTVATLRKLCERLFAVPCRDQRLFMRDGEDCAVPQPLDDDTRPLAYYGLAGQGGVEILVDDSA